MSGLKRKKRTRRRKREIPHSPSATNTRRRRLAYSRARCIKGPISETSLKRTYLSATTVPVGPPHLCAFQYRMTRSGTVVLRTKDGYGRGAAGWKTEVGPRAGRASRPRHSVVPEHGADRFLPRGRCPPIQIRPPRIRQPQCRSAPCHNPVQSYFQSKAVRSKRGAFLPRFPCCLVVVPRLGEHIGGTSPH